MNKQVFQTSSRKRWNRFRWSFRFILTILILLVGVFVTMFALEGSPNVPFKHDYRNVVSADNVFLKDNKTARTYKTFRDIFAEKKMHNNYATATINKHRFIGKGDALTAKYIAEWNNPRLGVRAAWYVNWDNRSYRSLKKNLKHLNMIIPEWFFINMKTDRVESRINVKALQLMRKAGVPIMPMLTNNVKGSFRPEAIGRIMRNPTKRKQLINDVITLCKRYHFSGVNIDFEELNINDNQLLTDLVKELSTACHAHNLYLTEDIEPFNEDYDVVALAKY